VWPSSCSADSMQVCVCARVCVCVCVCVKGVMGADFYRLDENRGGCCQLARREEGNSLNRAELGAACLALEDAKQIQDRKPIIFLSDSACFLTSSPKWIGEGKSPSI